MFEISLSIGKWKLTIYYILSGIDVLLGRCLQDATVDAGNEALHVICCAYTGWVAFASDET